jgi:NAD(P)-dependent dehydrogenase (short-subunit alcohol dehydrogenase family)
MAPRMDGKVAIVTGAGSGFGRATAHRFAAEGACVVVADIDDAAGRETVDHIETCGGRALLAVGDVADAEVAARAVDVAVERFGRLTTLVNNAGISQGPPRDTWDADDETWDRVLRANLRTATVCSRAAIPAMVDNGGGSVVNVASIAASVSVGGAAYAASKGGMLSFTRHIARELASRNVRVNCVSPGFMRTPMSSGERLGLGPAEQESRLADMARRVPMRRTGTVDDVANALLFFASDESQYITGQELVVDGGYLVR